MKLEKISIDGKKDSLEVTDKIFSAKKTGNWSAMFFTK